MPYPLVAIQKGDVLHAFGAIIPDLPDVVKPRTVLRAIDQTAQQSGCSRSNFLALATLLSARESPSQ